MKRSKNEIRIPEPERIAEIIELAELGKKARVVFHDLANHITALSLSISHLENSFAEDSERLSQYSKRSSQARHQMEYVAELLRSHIKNTESVTFNINFAIRKTLESFIDKAKKEGVKILFGPDKIIEIFGNKSAFTQIISNLATNAFDALKAVTENREKLICINTRKSGRNVLISFSDTGCGINENDLPRLFEQGFTTKENGHGIGLATTKEYVEEVFSGKIRVRSNKNGTRFLIKVPLLRRSPLSNLSSSRKPRTKMAS